MSVRKTISDSISKALAWLSLDGVSFVVEHPAAEDFGDYASNAALVAFAKTGDFQSPRQLAEKIVEELRKDETLGSLVVLDRIEVAGAGFINFWLKEDWLQQEARRALEDSFGRSNKGRGKRVLVEYSSPNIAKNFSVGHFRSTIIGQSIRNMYDFLGYETVGDNHLGDWGTQFGMMIALVEEGGLDLASMSVEEMEKAYVEYNRKAKEDEGVLERAREAFLRLERGDEKAKAIWQTAVDKSMVEFARIYELIGVKIENAYGESTYEDLMKKIVEEAKAKGVAVESQGALIVEFADLPPAMLLKSNKTTTYFTRDLATIRFRQETASLKADLYVYEVGAEQQLHFRQVFAAAEKLGYGKKESFKHVWHGMILGKDGKKMSTRKGTTVKIEEWLKEMVEKAAAINPNSAQEVGIGAVKYFDLKHDPTTSYRFDWEEALRLDGDSGPYLQYGAVRAASVLNKAGEYKKEVGWVEVSEEEKKILRWLYRFPEMVEKAAEEFSPNLLCGYLFELAQRFNSFYNNHQIIGSDKEAVRLLLCAACEKTLKSGLSLLGISIPKKM